MKKTDLTTHNAAELQTMLEEARARVAQYRFDLADKKLKRTSDIAATRRLIARILTVLNREKIENRK
ncbi:MAG: 50S ribosomal protein L29 [Patescibacteria group bacterium]